MNVPERTAALARAVKKQNRSAAKLFARSGWKGYLILITFIIEWIETSELGAETLAQCGGDMIMAISTIIDLNAAGLVEFIHEPSEEGVSFWVKPVGFLG